MKNTALLMLDYINDIIHPEGKIAGPAAFVNEHNVIANANKTIAFARKHHLPMVFVKVGFNAGYPECPETSPIFSYAKKQQALQLNTWGTEFHADLHVQPTDWVVVKHRVSAFYATGLSAFLSAQRIENLIIAGVSTDMAVQTTARDAHDRDYKVTIVSDACASGSLELHEAALKLAQRFTTIVNTEGLKSESW